MITPDQLHGLLAVAKRHGVATLEVEFVGDRPNGLKVSFFPGGPLETRIGLDPEAPAERAPKSEQMSIDELQARLHGIAEGG